jgi:hypothetical protein
LQRVLSTVTLLGLLVATAAAFAITEHLKLQKAPLYGLEVWAGRTPPLHRGRPTVFSPVCNCKTDVARLGITLRHSDRLTATIVDSAGHTVWTLADRELLGAHRPAHWFWPGRTASGSAVPDGVYKPSVTVGGRTYNFANKITVDTQPPKVLSATGLKPVLLAGPRRSVAIKYKLGGNAHGLVYLDNRLVAVSRHRRPSDKIKWNGRRDHRPLPAGRYVLSIGARDLAGNETPAAGRKHVTVVVRYIEVTPQRTAVRVSRAFRVQVETAARRYTWRLGKQHGSRRGRTLRLRAPSNPGTYRLVVTENGHAATAVVRVHK